MKETKLYITFYTTAEAMATESVCRENKNETYKVLASEAHVVKNITHFANSQGKKTSVKEVGLDFEIIVE